MMKSLIIILVVVNSIGWCYGTRVAHSVTIIPSSNDECKKEGQYCSALPWQLKFCCEGLICQGFLSSDNRCVKDSSCRPNVGDPCALLSPCCYPNHCSNVVSGSVCLAPSTTTTTTTNKPLSSILSLGVGDE
ncbi:hypothetical protein G4B88_007055 [Cannabis sativa]|uniref:Uncharacterized protein n=1 Tax=Cannabis sativa TaxID=3483 RepID=A0A7J6FNM1_CANSA|nr:hypothetical protein G4B88_007055 [Cannabis sativa]